MTKFSTANIETNYITRRSKVCGTVWIFKLNCPYLATVSTVRTFVLFSLKFNIIIISKITLEIGWEDMLISNQQIMQINVLEGLFLTKAGCILHLIVTWIWLIPDYWLLWSYWIGWTTLARQPWIMHRISVKRNKEYRSVKWEKSF